MSHQVTFSTSQIAKTFRGLSSSENSLQKNPSKSWVKSSLIYFKYILANGYSIFIASVTQRQEIRLNGQKIGFRIANFSWSWLIFISILMETCFQSKITMPRCSMKAKQIIFKLASYLCMLPSLLSPRSY